MNDSPQSLPQDASVAWRIVDVGTHRVLEALRTLEDFARFGLESQPAVQRLKALRHDFRQVVEGLPGAARLESRSLARDVGTSVEGSGEYDRETLRDVVRAAAGRLFESLRSLEEYAKIVAPQSARTLEQLRYSAYELETRLVDPSGRRARLAELKVCLLVDLGPPLERLEQNAERFIEAGMGMVQLRAKSASDRELLAAAERLRDRLANQALLVVNDRADVALLADADGVHVGQNDLPESAARRIVGEGRLVGVSTHSDQELSRVAIADYVGFGPMFASTTKSFHRFQEGTALRDTIERSSLPVVAIGGIGPDNVARLAAEGCRHVAVCGSVWRAEDPVEAVRRMADILTRGTHRAPGSRRDAAREGDEAVERT